MFGYVIPDKQNMYIKDWNVFLKVIQCQKAE